jgi:hypothetical protein
MKCTIKYTISDEQAEYFEQRQSTTFYIRTPKNFTNKIFENVIQIPQKKMQRNFRQILKFEKLDCA